MVSAELTALARKVAHHRGFGTEAKAEILVELGDIYAVLGCEARAKEEDLHIHSDHDRRLMADVEDDTRDFLLPHMEAYDRDDPGRRYARKIAGKGGADAR